MFTINQYGTFQCPASIYVSTHIRIIQEYRACRQPEISRDASPRQRGNCNDEQSITFSVDLVLTVYFWMVVHAARRKWYEEQQPPNEFDMRETVPATQPDNGSEPKSPSFLSQNFSMFQSPKPPTILPKEQK